MEVVGPEDLAPPSDGPIRSIAEPGIKVPFGDGLKALRAEVAKLLSRHQTSFPGAQPVSFARKHLLELKNQDYFVCEKSDGIRYLMYLTSEMGAEAVYLIDRKNDFWHIGNESLHFPQDKNNQAHHDNTIIDGELVFDHEDGKQVPRFLIFDCLVIDGLNLTQRSYDKRIAYVKEHIVKPYKRLLDEFPSEIIYQPFGVVMKRMEFSYGIPMIFNVILPQLKHGNDGLIFTCVNSKYKFGTDDHILKWKPPEENTVDCRLRLTFPTVQPDDAEIASGFGSEPFVDYDSVPRAAIWSFHGDRQYQFFADVFITEQEWDTLKGLGDPLVDRIVECHKDENGRWRILRFRDDKAEANHISTLNSVLESIEDRVTEKDLTDSATGIKNNWKMRAQQRG